MSPEQGSAAATLVVREHATVEATLTAELASAIHADGHLRVAPLGPGRFLLRARGKVGVVRYGDLEVRIVPKVPIGRLLHLAAHGRLDAAWRDLDTRLGGIDDPRSALAHVLVWHVERAFRPTPIQGYRTEESAEYHLRGRVLFERQIARRAGVLMPVELRHDEFDTDIIENRVLLAALRRVDPAVGDPALAHALDRLRHALDGVRPWPAGCPVPEIPWTRLNLRYRPAIRLARLLLDHGSVELEGHAIDGRGFLLDMPSVFESFLTVALADALERFGGEVRAQYRTALDEDDEVVMRPDITWWRDGCCRAVVDAKYKRVSGSSEPNADVYQMLAYCTRLGLDEGWLVYADLDGGSPTSRRIRKAGVTVYVVAIDLGGSIERLQDSVALLAGRLVTGCTPSGRMRAGE